ncbi:flagellar export chaperone FlgN [Ferrimonas lipolytica]|uniref:Flagellar protein FlgN n=1 Tax=Ferrimonas lipolytica TaxID=2724191 RepID=A0A6H1UDS2_9GAMM|nr:flagellar export chaperone FlgN [Ferrimonas lipolytica]QIZ77257.1 flagellar protein FlgN [Ferrimonas lipolytica]
MASPSLDNMLSQQLTRLGQLLALLEQETEALVNRNIDDIETLLKRKVGLLDEIKMADISISRHGDIKTLAEQPEQLALVEQCKQALSSCHERNSHNHKQAELVSASLTRLQQLLLRSSHSNALTYTGKGNTHVGQRLGRSIIA